MDDRTHQVLLALAGRIDDDLLAWCRELVAVGEDGRALELITATLVADGTALPPQDRAAVVDAARAARTDLDADAALPSGTADDTPHRFDAGHGVEVLAAAVGALPERLVAGCRTWVTFRSTPAGSAPGPLPQPVVLVEVAADDPRPLDVLAYQMATACARVGVPSAAVEVVVAGAARPAYQQVAAAHALPVHGADAAPHTDPYGTAVQRPDPWDTPADTDAFAVQAPQADIPADEVVDVPGAGSDHAPSWPALGSLVMPPVPLRDPYPDGDSVTDDRVTDDRVTDDRVTDDRVTDDRATHDRATHDRATHDRATEPGAADDVRSRWAEETGSGTPFGSTVSSGPLDWTPGADPFPSAAAAEPPAASFGSAGATSDETQAAQTQAAQTAIEQTPIGESATEGLSGDETRPAESLSGVVPDDETEAPRAPVTPLRSRTVPPRPRPTAVPPLPRPGPTSLGRHRPLTPVGDPPVRSLPAPPTASDGPALASIGDPFGGPIEERASAGSPRRDPAIDEADPLGLGRLPVEPLPDQDDFPIELPDAAAADSWLADWISGDWAMSRSGSADPLGLDPVSEIPRPEPAEDTRTAEAPDRSTGRGAAAEPPPVPPLPGRRGPGRPFPRRSEPFAPDRSGSPAAPALPPRRPSPRPEPAPVPPVEQTSFGLAPESVARLSDSDRALLARLQAELGDTPRPRVSRRAGIGGHGTPTPNGDGPHPPDLAG